MKAIHGGKAKNDKIDAHKIAVLLRGGMIPQAYVYPEGALHSRSAAATDASNAQAPNCWRTSRTRTSVQPS
jgi:hypothetical protein